MAISCRLVQTSVFAAVCCCMLVFQDCLFLARSASLRPVRIGALVDANSTFGKEISEALHLALRHVNQAHDLYNGTRFELLIADCGCDPFQGAASAMELIAKETVLILGPQSSVVAHFVAHIGKAAKVPILSFGATDPSLEELQYSYFFRVLPSDGLQMEAVAALIAIFDWKEVAVIYTDDDYGANGASALRQHLQVRGINLIAEMKIFPDSSQADIRAQLMNLDDNQSRVFVLHTRRMLGFRILSEANNLHMLMSGYVWIVTDLFSSGVHMPAPDLGALSFDGLLGTRRFILRSGLYMELMKQWQEQYTKDMQSLFSKQLNPYAVFAYDAFHAAALAISSHLAQGHTLKFNEYCNMHGVVFGHSDIQCMKILESGPALRESLLHTTFLGVSGVIQLDNGKFKSAVFEYVNTVKMNLLVVAYWATDRSISILPPQISKNFTSDTIVRGVNSSSLNITWPGGSTEVPQGWVPNRNGGKPLKIGVPKKAGYNELVSQTKDSENVARYDGFCIMVFETAVKQLNYSVTYEFVSFTSKMVGKINPLYDDIVNMVASEELDAAVGDITITSERLRVVDFTQPYIESGLVVLVKKIDKTERHPLAFMRPFTAIMWITLFSFTVLVGLVIWFLEHQDNPEFGGSVTRQVTVSLWFIFSTLFTAHREDTKSILARVVLILWLFIVLIVNSSYTANLTAILTVEQLTPEFQGLDSLVRSNEPIGFQTGSFVQNYLIVLGVSADRLKDLGSPEAYKSALDLGPSNGGVAAIVDELPYIQIFLAAHCKHYTVAGQIFTKSGWGFAFPKGSQLAEDLSIEILRMSTTGQLSHMHDYWIREQQCSQTESTVQDNSNQLGVQRFWVLFVMMGAMLIVCVSTFIVVQIRSHGISSIMSTGKQFVGRFKEFVRYRME